MFNAHQYLENFKNENGRSLTIMIPSHIGRLHREGISYKDGQFYQLVTGYSQSEWLPVTQHRLEDILEQNELLWFLNSNIK